MSDAEGAPATASRKRAADAAEPTGYLVGESPYARSMRLKGNRGDDLDSIIAGIVGRFAEPSFVFVVSRNLREGKCKCGCGPHGPTVIAASATLAGAKGALYAYLYEAEEAQCPDNACMFRNAWREDFAWCEHAEGGGAVTCDCDYSDERAQVAFERDLDALFLGDARAFDWGNAGGEGFYKVVRDKNGNLTEGIGWIESEAGEVFNLHLHMGGFSECCSRDRSFDIRAVLLS